MKYNAKKELKEHRKKHGTSYMLPSGEIVKVKDKDLPKWLDDNKLTIRTPMQQPTLEQLKRNEWYL